MSRAPVYRKGQISIAALREEGVLEIGRPAGTSALFVRTRVKLHIFHPSTLPDRALDEYAITLAVNWLTFGHSSREVAANLGVSPNHLTSELASAGYERLSIEDGKPRAGSRERIMSAKRARAKGPGRRGALVKVGPGRFKFSRTVSP